MTTAANVDTAGIKQSLVARTDSDRNVFTEDVRWTLIEGMVATQIIKVKIFSRKVSSLNFGVCEIL